MGSRQNQSDGPTRVVQFFRQENIHTNMFTPRTCQVELLDAALQRNTIVCLGATTGKTFIATLLIKELAHQVVPPVNKRTVVLVASANVANEQARVIAMHSHLSVSHFVQESISQAQWDDEFEQHQVLVTTADIFLSVVRRDFVVMSRVNLLVFDECHLAVGSHPYVEIMKHYKGSPRILGVTTSILGSKCETSGELEQMLSDLETMYQSTAETSTDMVVPDVYSARPTEMFLDCDMYSDKTGLVKELDDVLAPVIEFLQDCRIGADSETSEKDPCVVPRTVLLECQNILHTLGPWCAGKVAQVLMRRVTKVIEYESSQMTKLMLHLANTQLCLVQVLTDQVFDQKVECLDDFLRYVSPKVLRLLEILHQYKPADNFVILGDDGDAYLTDDDETDDSLDLSDDDNKHNRQCVKTTKSNRHAPKDKNTQYVAVRRAVPSGDAEPQDDGAICGIAFVERRHTAFALNKLITELCNWDTDLFFVRSHHMTGKTGKGAESEMLYKKQEDVLRQFRQREVNLLIATSVLEEGVDVPKCNLVVRFDLPTNYNSYVHSKGRARASNSKYYMLMDKQGDRFVNNMKTFKEIEKILITRCHSWEEETSEDINPTVTNTLLPPYVTREGEEGATVKMTLAISLVNRYCAKLPSDTFTHLAPHCTVKEVSGGDALLYRGVLQLPINSPIKEPVRGEAMATKKLAKMAVALKACEILHKAGELDDRLMPVGKDIIKYEDDENEWEDHETHGLARPGTTKHKQYYYKRVAQSLVGHPRPQATCHLYLVNMTLTCPITEEQNTRGRKIYAPEETHRTFGLVSSRLIPKVPLFPVFTRSGEVTLSLDIVTHEARFSEAQFDQMLQFHHFLFGQVLRLDKDPMRFDPRNAACGYIIVPLNGESDNHEVDWPFVEMITKSSAQTKKTQTTDEEFVFDQSKFEDAVVMPSYRNTDQPQYFYVAEIRHDLTPTSPFPSPEAYRTFEDYYSSKYELKITNLSQPLLDVDHTSARLNLLTPRYMNQKGVALPTSSAETRKARRENLQQKQILIPELCDIHPFPASLWRKAICIPAILYRINCLLVAEELRVLIAREAHVGVRELPCGFRFPKLQFGFEMKRGFCTPAAESGADPCTCSGASPGHDGKSSHVVDDVNDVVEKPKIGESKCVGEKIETDAKSESCETDANGGNGNDVVETGRGVLDEDGKQGVNLATESTVMNNAPGTVSDNTGSCDGVMSTSKSNDDVEASTKDVGMCLRHSAENADRCLKATNLTSGSAVHSEAIIPSHEVGGSGEPAANELSLGDPLVCRTAGGDNAGEFPNGKRKDPRGNGNTEETHPMGETGKLNDGKTEVMEVGRGEDYLAAVVEDEHGEDRTVCKARGCDTDTVDCVATCETRLSVFDSDGAADCDKDNGERQGGKCKTLVNSSRENGDISHSCNPSGSDNHAASTSNSEVGCAAGSNDCTPPFTFDNDVDLDTYIGPSSCTILQSLTMSNANDFFNLERLETIGDSFLKFAITVYLYCTYPGIHEGKLSYLRSKQVSNYNLYRQGKRKGLAECMIATKFEPMENWLPPGFVVSQEGAFKGLDVYVVPSVRAGNSSSDGEQADDGKATRESTPCDVEKATSQQRKFNRELAECTKSEEESETVPEKRTKFLIPYNLQTQHSLPDKSIADCVEALIGCYLTSCGQRAALQFMSWLGLKVLPDEDHSDHETDPTRGDDKKSPTTISHKTSSVPSQKSANETSGSAIAVGQLQPPPSPLLMHVPRARDRLDFYLMGSEAFERNIQYHFRDRSYLLQAFTHASYHYNTVTDCYQRLEFLGDAILDYVITRQLFENPVKHSPGILTDLRSALVNNNIFAALAVKWDFHKYFKALSPQLFLVVDKFVSRQKENNDEINMDEEFDDTEDSDSEVSEDTEIPKALGDIFESVAGAIYLDSGMSLDTVWRVYYRMMKPQIDTFTAKIPKSPVRELLEMEPETAKFEKPIRTLNGRIRVNVNVVGKGSFQGIGRNYRIAKSAAAKRALKSVRQHNLEMERLHQKQQLMFQSLFGQ